MAHFQNHYASPAGRRTDEYGNPVERTDEYGNPIRPADAYGNPVYPGTDPYGKLGSAPPPATGHGVGAEHGKEHHTLGGMLRRSGSSSSSSSSVSNFHASTLELYTGNSYVIHYSESSPRTMGMEGGGRKGSKRR